MTLHPSRDPATYAADYPDRPEVFISRVIKNAGELLQRIEADKQAPEPIQHSIATLYIRYRLETEPSERSQYLGSLDALMSAFGLRYKP